MSRRGIHSEYLDLSKGQRIEAETLEEALVQHPEVTTVVLFWKWSQDYYTSNASVFEAYVSESRIDEEYSFFGDREDALEYASNYDCWDGDDFILLKISKGYCLYGYRDEVDMQTSWNDGYDHSSGVSKGIDPSWLMWLQVDFDYSTGTEYLLSPDPLPKVSS